MALLFQTAGVMAAGMVLVTLTRQVAPEGRSGYAVVAVIPVVVACVVAFSNVETATRGFYDQRKVNRRLPAGEAALRGGVVGAVNVTFLDWVKGQMGPRDSFYLVVGNEAAHPTAFQWATYQLAPRLAVSDPERADWVVFYDRGRSQGYPGQTFGAPEFYAANYLLGRRRRAR